MHRILIGVLVFLLSACAIINKVQSPTLVIIDKPIVIDWGLKDGGTLRFTNAGIPGNIASFPNTLTPQSHPLRVIVIGQTLRPGERIEVRVLGSHEQASPQGLISTIIATTDDTLDLAAIEHDNSGALGVVEAGLTQLSVADSRSLGFRPAAIAHETIYQYRKKFYN